MRWAAILSLVACSPIELRLRGESGLSSDADADADTDGDTDSGSTYVTDYASFSGARRFVVNNQRIQCDGTVTEPGVALAPEDDIYPSVSALCPTCMYFYTVTPDQPWPCGLQLGVTYRGLKVDEENATAIVHLYVDPGTGMMDYATDDTAALSAGVVSFGYQYPYGADTFDVTGTMTFARTEQ